MARIKLPKTIIEWFMLFDKTKEKHDADATSSVLIPYNAEQDIDLDDDADARSNAANAHVLFLQLEKETEVLTEKRDKIFKHVFGDHKKCVQFLKNLFRNNVHKLGEWSVTVNGSNRIVYPVHFLESAFAIDQFIVKHLSYAAGTSPLQPFLDENEIDLAQNQADLVVANNTNTDFLDKDAQKEAQRELRDNLFAPVKDHLRGIGRFLVSLYPQIPHKAGNWGFVINASPKAETVRRFNLSDGEIKIVKNIKLKSKVKNNGPKPLLLRPANDPYAMPYQLDADKEFTVVRGYGKMLVENPSGSGNGAFEASLYV